MASGSLDHQPSAINLLSDSRDIYGSILNIFQQNHDLCTRSGFIPSSALLQIDSCAIDFRKLGLQTATVAKLVSNMWLSSIILFYEHISLLSHALAVKELQRYARQAQKLSQIFKVIAAWARDLAGRIHSACLDLGGQIDAFKIKFAQVLQDNQLLLNKAKEALTAKQEDLQDKIAESKRWKISLGVSAVGYLLFFPIGALGSIITGSGYAVARKAVHDARDAELEAEKNLQDAQKRFDSAKNNNEKAKMIAEVAAGLLQSLDGMQVISEAIGTFWTQESSFFVGQASDILANQVHSPQGMLVHVVSNEQITAWTEAKHMFDQYAAVMATIMNIFNYTNNATEIPSTSYHIAELAYTLKVPNTINVDSIMEDDQADL